MTPDDQWLRDAIRAFEDDQRIRTLAWQAGERAQRLQLLAACSPDDAARLLRQFSTVERARLDIDPRRELEDDARLREKRSARTRAG